MSGQLAHTIMVYRHPDIRLLNIGMAQSGALSPVLIQLPTTMSWAASRVFLVRSTCGPWDSVSMAQIPGVWLNTGMARSGAWLQHHLLAQAASFPVLSHSRPKASGL